MTTASVGDRYETVRSKPERVGRLLREACAGFGFWFAFVAVLEPGNLLRAAHAGIAVNGANEALRIICAGLLGALVSPLPLWLGRRFPVRGPCGIRNAVVVLAAIAVLALAMVLAAGLVAPWLPPNSVRGRLGDQVAGNLLLLMSGLAILVGCAQFRSNPEPQRAGNPDGAFLERIAVKSMGRTVFLDVGEIEWIEAQGNYVALHVGPTIHLVRETMAGIEARLDPRRFARVHRRSIVNLQQVREIRSLDGGDARLTLQSGSATRLSRSYRASLRGRLLT